MIHRQESDHPTPYAVWCVETFDVGKPPCNSGRLIYLTDAEYSRQMELPDAVWKCPRCGGEAQWSDENYESAMDALERSEGGE